MEDRLRETERSEKEWEEVREGEGARRKRERREWRLKQTEGQSGRNMYGRGERRTKKGHYEKKTNKMSRKEDKCKENTNNGVPDLNVVCFGVR